MTTELVTKRNYDSMLKEGDTIRDNFIQHVTKSLGDIPKSIRTELEVAIPQTYFEMVQKCNLRHPKNDLKPARDEEAGDIWESFSAINLLPLAPLVVMQVDGYKEIIDGMTRFDWWSTQLNEFGCLVIPVTLSDEAAIALNLTLNTKRNGINETVQMDNFERLADAGWTPEQIAERSGYSTANVALKLKMQKHLSPKIKTSMQLGQSRGWSNRKSEEAFDKLVDNETIPQKTNWAIQDAVVDIVRTRVKELTRDWMAGADLDAALERNANVMWKDYTPEQIAKSSILTGEQSDFICEHPDKIDAVEQIVNSVKPQWYLGLPSEGAILYDTNGCKIETNILRASKRIKKVYGVGFFEGAKKDDLKKFKIPHYQGDMFLWLDKKLKLYVKKCNGKGVIFIDSFGSLKYCSLPLLQRLLDIPNATVLFLVQDKFGNSRNNKDKLEEDCWTYWGIEVPKNMKKFIRDAKNKLHNPVNEVWHSINRGQKMYLLRADS